MNYEQYLNKQARDAVLHHGQHVTLPAIDKRDACLMASALFQGDARANRLENHHAMRRGRKITVSFVGGGSATFTWER